MREILPSAGVTAGAAAMGKRAKWTLGNSLWSFWCRRGAITTLMIFLFLGCPAVSAAADKPPQPRMLKVLFFDYRSIERMKGFDRKVFTPIPYKGNPIFLSTPLETNSIYLYGAVVRHRSTGLWQMWYTAINKGRWVLAYAISKDGITWQRPNLDVIKRDGHDTNFVFDENPQGAAIIYDRADPRPGWKYKMICGAAPSGYFSVYRSADGIHWVAAAKNPVINTDPDCPMGLVREPDGKYVAYLRPRAGDRRIGRSTSWDFIHWSRIRMVLDQSPQDPPQTQFYGMGVFPYGGYQLGTLWIYHTYASDMGIGKMDGHQEPELAYGRSGYAWHRLARGTPWIKLGAKGSWDWGLIEPACQPVMLKSQIRFYFAGSRTSHGFNVMTWKKAQPRCGVGFVSIKPDRFVGLVAAHTGRLLTRPLWIEVPKFYVNAKVAPGGSIRVELTNVAGDTMPGFNLKECVPVTGDSLHHQLRWLNNPNTASLANHNLRFRVVARHATLFAIESGPKSELADYWRFRIP